MKRIAICSVDNRAREVAEWLSKKTHEFTKEVRVLDYRVGIDTLPYCLEVETTVIPDIDIHVGTRYDIDLAHISKGDFLHKMIHLIEKIAKNSGNNMDYDMAFIIYSNTEDTNELNRCYTNIYNLNTKILPNRPASILGKMIVKHMKLIPPKEKK